MTGEPHVSKRIVRRVLVPALGGLLVIGAVLSGPTASQAAPPTAPRADRLRAAQDAALEAGLQVAPKGLPSARRSATGDPDPALSTLPSLRRADYSGWRTRDAAQAEARAGAGARAQAGRTGRARGVPTVRENRTMARSVTPPRGMRDFLPRDRNGITQQRATRLTVRFGAGTRR